MQGMAATVALASLLIYTAPAHALDCPGPPAQTARHWDAKASAEVAQLGRMRGALLEGRVQTTTDDLIRRLPNADRVYVEQMVFAAYCSALRDDKNLAESVKAERIAAYQARWQLDRRDNATTR